ncbi:MAG: hypothetical protein NZ958_00595 [Bacteroidia bacterium]|nr:hypothetical protein [Bacteroidia bacterium]MDW8089504.1 hypothetical protein [Bacteroidia bacterium]
MGWGAWAQTPSTPLAPVYQAIQRGLTLNAQRQLQKLQENPDSLVRWESLLLQGYLAARGGRENEALSHWYRLSQYTPHSPLGREATYWRADLLLKKRSTCKEALFLLRDLLESPHTPPALRTEAAYRLTHFAYYEADLGFLWTYADEGHPLLQAYFLPALLYWLRQGCYWELWPLKEKEIRYRCGEGTHLPWSWAALADTLSPETLRVALLMPFLAHQEKPSPFLEFWQGFELGLREARSPYRVWEVRVEDSERNPLRLQEILLQWETRPPHILIGEVSWSLNQTLSSFCARKGIWQAVPINTAYPKYPYTFPLLPPAECQGQFIGTQLRKEFEENGLGVCLYDASDPQAVAFAEGFRQVRPCPLYPLPSDLKELTQRWTTLKDSLQGLAWYALACNREDLLGFLLHKLGRDSLPPLIIGTATWNDFQYTYFKDYRRLRIWIPQVFLPDSAAWRSLNQRVRQLFAQPATLYHAQGYDAALWIATLSNAHTPYAPLPRKEMPGLLNTYLLPPQCERYRFRLWEYEKGEIRLRYGN